MLTSFLGAKGRDQRFRCVIRIDAFKKKWRVVELDYGELNGESDFVK